MLNVIVERMQRFFDHIFAYYDLLLPIGSDESTKRLQTWWNNPQCGHKEGKTFPNFWWQVLAYIVGSNLLVNPTIFTESANSANSVFKSQ